MVKDTNSKFGVFINQERIKSQADVELEDGHEIIFGGQKSAFIALVGQRSIVTLNYLKHISKSLSEEINCESVTKGSSSEYNSEYEKFFSNLSFLPDCSKFLPPYDESIRVDAKMVKWDPQNKRCTLFLNKCFVFFSQKLFDRYEPIIVAASGEAVFVEIDKDIKSLVRASSNVDSFNFDLKKQAAKVSKHLVDTVLPEKEIETGVSGSATSLQLCIVVPSTSSMKNTNDKAEQQRLDIIEKLSRSIAEDINLRVIKESEIGLSILYMSCECYSNPDPKVNTQISMPSSESASLNYDLSIKEPRTKANSSSKLSQTQLTSFNSTEINDNKSAYPPTKKESLAAPTLKIGGARSFWSRMVSRDNSSNSDSSPKIGFKDVSLSKSSSGNDFGPEGTNDISKIPESVQKSKPSIWKEKKHNISDLYPEEKGGKPGCQIVRRTSHRDTPKGVPGARSSTNAAALLQRAHCSTHTSLYGPRTAAHRPA
ncbi:hypothetical protein H4219_002180 [Mycoemilia scoparia]|uniref:FHA domain-containing protein n=1 Tax=Mycoemilia scoparia TaxID=417184 RepID=A0A9W7ZZ12_9FUNG|nr:hypothetical protein H4219_002180 [Mycoemilia scoparia]